MPRKPWGTFAVTCNSAQANTNFVRRFDLEANQSCTHDQFDNTRLTGSHRFFQILNSLFLTSERVTLLVVQPAQLLEDFGVVRVTLQDPTVSGFCSFELHVTVSVRYIHSVE